MIQEALKTKSTKRKLKHDFVYKIRNAIDDVDNPEEKTKINMAIAEAEKLLDARENTETDVFVDHLHKLLVLFVATVLVACHASDYQMYPLRLKTGHVEQYSTVVLCESWRLGVEVNNLIKWKTVPEACQEFVADYVLGNQYRSDSKTVCREAYFYAKTLNITD
ncbi:hypothetical protein V8G54_004637 [Vigna mungo]|uniref:Uncharacterized protein n=1 Tax=Vigna mungo TaxID=3915 RepID=A0AAQ3PGY9_VIGMU